MARRAFPLLAALIALAAPAPAHAAAAAKKKPPAAPEARRFTVQHAISLVGYGEMAWSPDASKLAFVVAGPDTAESATNYDLYLADIGRDSVRRLTRNPKGDGSPSFSPSGDTLAFVSTRGSDDKQTIYMMALEGGDPWTFGSFDEAIGEVHWSPNGRYLAYTKNDTLPRAVVEQRRKKWDGVVEDERTQFPQLWVADLATGARKRLVAGSFVVWNVVWSPDSRSLAYLTNPTWTADDANLTDIGVVSVAGGVPRTLGAIGGDFRWSPDSKWLAWSATRHRDVFIEKDELWVCPPTGGAPVSVTADFDESAGVPAWNATSDTLSFHVAMGLTTLVGVVPRAGGPIRLTADRHGAAGNFVGARTGRVAWVESHDRIPDEIEVADHPELPGRPITRLNAGVVALELGASRSVRWHDAEQNWVEGVLLRPPGESTDAATAATNNPKRYKTLVLLHSGPYGFRSDLGFNAQAQYFAAAGYQVFMPNYRGSGGYGTAFMVRQRHDWGGQDWDDVMRGVDEMVRSWGADPNRLGILGASYGGYLTTWGITQTDRFKAAHIDRGISDLPALWGQSDTHQYRAYDFGGRPWEVPDRWRERSPMTHIGDAKTPMLIVVGDNDARTPIAQSRELYTALRSLGVPVQLVHYPREGHGLREPRHRADALLRARAWFDRWIP